MSSCVSRQKSQIGIIDETSQAHEYDYLRPKGKMIYKIDSVYEVPKIGIVFEGWYVQSVSLWSKNKKVRQHFSMFESIPPVSPQVSSSDESRIVDTVY